MPSQAEHLGLINANLILMMVLVAHNKHAEKLKRTYFNRALILMNEANFLFLKDFLEIKF